ncbi:MAG: hypothetical protein D6749_12780 [Chloroflexota bacterium]|nr:MAG: hypothetical protein D6749_12780 [Chloroflexota bacterium]
MLKHVRFLLAALLFLSSLTAVSSARAAIVVHPGNLQGWFIGTVAPTGTPAFADFVNGLGTPPLGTGSYRVTISAANTKRQIARADYNNTPLSSLNISYYTYRAGTNTNDWYVNVYIHTTGAPGLANCRLDFAPNAGPLNTWTLQNATSASNGWYSIPACGTTLTNVAFATVLSTFPSAVLRSPFTAGAPAIVFNMGDTAAGYVNYDGAIDAITINGTTWDFELTAPAAPSSIDFFNPGDCRVDPKPGDRLAICCEASRIVVYGVANNSRGFFLSTFDFEDLVRAGRRGIFVNRQQDGVISASMSRSQNIWVAWNGGQYNATGQPDQGFAKLVRCPLPASVVQALHQRSE